MAEPDTESNEIALRAAEVATDVTEADKPQDQQRLVAAYMRAAGFTRVTGQASTPRQGDPLWIVIGTA